jgi:hypothetical protein
VVTNRLPAMPSIAPIREAYYWLRHNTKPDAKIMSW